MNDDAALSPASSGAPAQSSAVPRSAAMTSGRPAATAAALTGTLAPAAAAWVVTVGQMSGMDMGVATRLPALAPFIALWAVMMAAMMLPGAAPAVVQRARAHGAGAVPLFVGSYLGIWVLSGVVVHAVYRPHGSVVAGVVAIAAGGYELTSLKQYFRQRSRASTGSGWEFALCCAGSSGGLMALLVAVGVMSIPWTAAVTVVALGQKLLPARAALDVPLALSIVGLGIWILIEPATVPGLLPPM